METFDSKMRLGNNNRVSLIFVLLFLLIRNAQMIDFRAIRKRRTNDDAALPIATNQESVPLYSVNNTEAFIKETRENLMRAFGLRKSMLLMGKNFKKRKPHDYMLYIYREYGKLFKEGQPVLENTVRGCIDIDDGKRRLADFPHLTLKFDISEIPDSEILVNSQLKVLLQAPQVSKSLLHANGKSFFRAEILGVLPRKPEPHTGHHFPVLLTVKTKTIEVLPGRKEHWETFDISPFVVSIRGMQRKYIKFLLRIKPINSGSFIQPEQIGISSQTEQTKKALLVLFTDDEGKQQHPTPGSRTKRNADDSERSKRLRKREKRRRRNRNKNRKKWKKRNKSTCRVRKMIVDFSQFGWNDWVVSPANYSASYCGGTCKHPISASLLPTNHATIQSIVHSMRPDFVPAPCCVPRKYESLAMLYLDGEDRVVYKPKPDMIVKECACR